MLGGNLDAQCLRGGICQLLAQFQDAVTLAHFRGVDALRRAFHVPATLVRTYRLFQAAGDFCSAWRSIRRTRSSYSGSAL
jgi:hypothetical protein